jgi:hypothetical protein
MAFPSGICTETHVPCVTYKIWSAHFVRFNGDLTSLTAVGQLDVYNSHGILMQVEEDIVWLDVFVDVYSANDPQRESIGSISPV